MRFRFAFFLSLLALAVVLSACDSTEERSQTPIQYEFEFNKSGTIGSSSSTASKASGQAQIQFDSGFFTIREIVFDGENETTGESVSITHEQVSRIDFSTRIGDPPLDEVRIPAGTYRSVNLGIELQDVNDEPTVVMSGTYTQSDGTSVPLRFEFNSGEVFEADAASVTIEEDREATAVIKIDPVFWFSATTPASLDAANRVNGTIVVNDTLNGDIFDNVADQLDVATQAVFE